MSTDYYEPDVEDGYDDPLVVEPDESAHFQYARPQRRPGSHGPTNRDDLDVDYDYEEEARERHLSARALTGIIVVGSGVGALIWVFAGGFVALAVGGAGVLAWAGKRFVGWRRSRDRNGRGRGPRTPRQRSARRGMRDRLGLGGRGGRGAAARRAGLLAGMGAGGLGGRKGGSKGFGGGGGGGGRGPKLGPKGPKGGGGLKPKAGGGGLLGKLRPKGKGGVTSGARSGGLLGAKGGGSKGPKGRKGAHRVNPGGAGNPITRMMPGAKGRARRLAHHKAKTQAYKARTQAHEAKQRARQARHANRQHRRLNASFVRRAGRNFGAIGKWGVLVPLWFAAKYGVARPVAFAHRWVFVKPGDRITAWHMRVRAGRARPRRLRHLYKVMYLRPARRAWFAGRWADVRARFTFGWFMKLRDLARTRGRWAAALGALLLFIAGCVYAARKAREWAYDGKKARHPFAPDPADQQNTDPAGQQQPDPAGQQQPDPQQPDPAGTPNPVPKPRGNPWGYGTQTQEPAPVPGAVPPTSEGAPQMPNLTQQPTHVGVDLEIPGGIHPVFSSLLADARVLEGMFDPRSFPDLTIFLNSLPEKIRMERDKWQIVGDSLLSRFPGFNLAQEFAGEVNSAYTQLAVTADNVFAGYRDKMDATFARFMDPRVNEAYADVDQWGEGLSSQINPINLVDGSRMHGSHVLWLASVDMHLTGYFPAEQAEEKDYIVELLHWLQSLHPFFVSRAKYAQHFVTYGLVHGFPIEAGVADVVMQLARGYADLGDRGYALAQGYEARNPYDMGRRYQPKVNEAKRDVGNQEMTNA